MTRTFPKWYRLDNAAKIYPAFASEKDTATFRVAVILNNEIQPDQLQSALNIVVKRFPSMAVRMRKGLFWYYFDDNQSLPIIHKEETSPCRAIDPVKNNGYLFKVLYFNRRIALECFHALTDGYGALEFLKTLVYVYLKLEYNHLDHESMIKLPYIEPDRCEVEDSFNDYYDPNQHPPKRASEAPALHITGTPFKNNGINVTHGILSASTLNTIAKKKGVTITVYLTALLISAIYKASESKKKGMKPITISVPVNLRNIFPSKTMRNFSFYVNTYVKPEVNLPFETILQHVSTQLKEGIKKENLYNRFHNNVKAEKNVLMRLTPLFIKDIILKNARSLYGNKITTSTLTNPGIIHLPKSMERYVSHFECILYASKPHYINCGVCSYNDKLVISISRAIKENEVIQYFFQHIASYQDIQIYTNDWGDK